MTELIESLFTYFRHHFHIVCMSELAWFFGKFILPNTHTPVMSDYAI